MRTRRSILFLLLGGVLPAFSQTARPEPKLVVTIVVDQFRYDYLTRFRPGYHAGIDRLLTKGAVFADAHYIHFPTVTAVGHSTILTGATPSISGIIANEWYDRPSGATVTSVFDPDAKALGAEVPASSPKRLLVSTIGDELRTVTEQAKVVGISLKDRAAILPVGRMANGAYWFDNKSGNFISSTYYFPALPGWVKEFNAGRPADKYAGMEWMGTKYAAAGEHLNASLAASPWGNELVEAFAESAIQGEQLGQRGVTDLLAVSFSSNDYVGHALGPDSPEVKDMAFRTDLLFGKFFAFLEKQVGMKDVLVVMTSDHGVAPVPEVSVARKMPGGRFGAGTVEKTIQAALERKYGPGKWVAGSFESATYLNSELIEERKLDHAAVDRTAAEGLAALPHVMIVYTREQLMNGAFREDPTGIRVANGFYPSRSGDVFVVLEPYWLFGGGSKGTTHGTTFDYDTHVPVIFMGAGIKPGKYYGSVAVNDIAPTLAAMLNLETPSGSVGRILSEMFQ
ncbi:MAG: type phosphodiesterase/nucleotide pyrophosphatase [Bryobacterales bacterium]|nr:type phosphodiesterase/nucleotide pyrophosphatase [Bryobacterales bacterium]